MVEGLMGTSLATESGAQVRNNSKRRHHD
ncbi:protein of unknown function [Thiomonas sp. Bio17B3]|nr:protein of unknown function [Thiomonas sp. Bio17B3]